MTQSRALSLPPIVRATESRAITADQDRFLEDSELWRETLTHTYTPSLLSCVLWLVEEVFSVN